MTRLHLPCPPLLPVRLRTNRGFRRIRECLGAALVPLVTALPILPAPAAAEPELHVLIDVSGSMKKTDPENLREPALRLLGELVPEESRVRIDLFGNRITAILPASTATPETKRAMRQAAARVRSDEPFTDIPAALQAANTDWGEDSERNIILLSDGKVDISPDAAVNDRATARLREEVIPALIDAEVQVHTVALSEAADQAILTEIAERSGGLALSARSNEDLQRVFLALFEATAPRTGVPLVDNRFRIDDSVSELTLVVFRAGDAAPTRIRIPGGGEIDVHTARALADWRWDDSAGRDLITVRNPPAGSWRILAAEDPDNRALVITDLKLAMPGLPSRLFPGETVDGTLVLTNHGKPITEPRLTSDIEAQLTARDPRDTVIETLELNDIGAGPDVIGGDSRYDFRLRLDGETGIYTIEGRASGPTFERVLRRKIALARLLPFEARVVRPRLAARDGAAGETDGASGTQLIIEQDVALLDPGESRLVARIECGTGEPTAVEAALDKARNRIDLPSTQTADCRVVGKVIGTTEDGRQVNLPLDESIPGPPASPETPADEAAEDEVSQQDTGGNPLLAGAIGLGGLALLLGLGLGWRASDRRRRRQLIEAARD